MDWIDLLIAAPFVVLLGLLLFKAGSWKHLYDQAVASKSIASVEILVDRDAHFFHFFRSRTMLQGDVAKFKVVCKNKHGAVVPASDVAVSVSPPTLAAAVVTPDGANGSLTAAVNEVGTGALAATAGGVSSAHLSFVVEADVKIASVEVVPV